MTAKLWNTLYGERLYIVPGIATSPCGTWQKTHLPRVILPIREDPLVELSRRLLTLQISLDIFERGLDQTRVYEQLHAITPSHLAPKYKPTFIYERDEVDTEDLEGWMIVRAMMLELAYVINGLFTISLVPREPEKRQTWYQKNILFSVPDAPATPTFISRNKVSVSPKTSQDNPEVQLGFIKPFESFSSKEYAPDSRFDNIEITYLSTREEINTSSFSDIENHVLKKHLTLLLLYFWIDKGAKEIALTFHDNGRAHFRRFAKKF